MPASDMWKARVFSACLAVQVDSFMTKKTIRGTKVHMIIRMIRTKARIWPSSGPVGRVLFISVHDTDFLNRELEHFPAAQLDRLAHAQRGAHDGGVVGLRESEGDVDQVLG